MIIFIRIPHQSPASFDVFRSQDEVLSAAIDYAIDSDRDEPETYDDAKNTLADDLSRSLWIESADDAKDVASYTGHQEHKVRAMAEEIAEYFA